MVRIRKVFSIKIVSIVICTRLLFAGVVCSNETLRLPVGTEKLHERISEVNGPVRGNVSTQDLYNALGWNDVLASIEAEAIDLMRLDSKCTVVAIGPSRFPQEVVSLASRGAKVIVVQPDKYVDTFDQNDLLRKAITDLNEQVKTFTGIDIMDKISFIDELMENAEITPHSASAIIMMNVSSIAPDESTLFNAAIAALVKDGYILHGDIFETNGKTACEQFEEYYHDKKIPIKIIRKFEKIKCFGRPAYKLYQIQIKTGTKQTLPSSKALQTDL